MDAASKNSTELTQRWFELCSQYLPIAPEGSIWRYSRSADPKTREQGWKLHVSATILNAPHVLQRVAPVLLTHDVQFKAPSSLQHVSQLNSGVHYAYSQIGKVITVYPQSDEQAVELARCLHRLTKRFPAPAVPFDNCFGPKSNVYYRYGAFAAMEVEFKGDKVRAIKDPKGNLVPDLSLFGEPTPEWLQDPFPKRRLTEYSENPLKNSFRVFRALSQRGKGGVYQAVDIRVKPPRLCLLKEGRKLGEVSWDGRDGRWRVQQEERALSVLRDRGVDVPRIYGSFQLGGNYYLVTEYIEGESLHSFLRKQQRRLSIRRVLHLSKQLADFMAQIHRAGWVWRDCKPANLILTKDKLRSLDFESAYPIDRSDRPTWGTPGFLPRIRPEQVQRTAFDDDLFALGAVIHLLTTGLMPGDTVSEKDISRRRRGVPAGLSRIIVALLDARMRTQLDAVSVSRELSTLLSKL